MVLKCHVQPGQFWDMTMGEIVSLVEALEETRAHEGAGGRRLSPMEFDRMAKRLEGLDEDDGD